MPRPKTLVLLAVAATIAVALNQRPAVVALSPLLDTIRADTGLSAPLAGLLTSLPVLCFGIFSPIAPRMARRIGLETAVGLSLVILVIGILLRLVTPVTALYAGSLVAGAGIAVANVLMPAYVKREFPNHASAILGVYTAALNVGAAVAAGLTVPIATAFALEWRPALALWVVLAGLGLALWIPIMVRAKRSRAGMSDEQKGLDVEIRGLVLLRNPLGRQVTGYLAMQSFQFYAYAAWLPTLLVDDGMPAGTAGLALMVSGLTGATGAVLMPLFTRRLPDQRVPIVILVVLYLIPLVGLIIAPTEGAWIWVSVYGVAQGAGFAMALTLIVLRSPDSAVAARLSGVAQLVGYLIAATGPVILGLIHDLTGGWEWSLGLLVVLLVPSLFLGLGAGRNRVIDESSPDGLRPAPEPTGSSDEVRSSRSSS